MTTFGWNVWRSQRRIAAALAVLLSCQIAAVTSWAQPTKNRGEVVANLQRAAEAMEAASNFFISENACRESPTAAGCRQRVSASPQDFATNYQKMKDGAAIFSRFANTSFLEMSLENVQRVFGALRAAKPATIMDAVEECDRRRDPKFTQSVSGSLHFVFWQAWQTETANATFGPIIDNPTLYGTVTPASNRLEMLHNIKIALDRDFLLRDDFFTPENMRRFFAIKAVVVRWPDRSIRIHHRIFASKEELEVIEPVMRPYSWCDIDVERYVGKEDGKLSGRISMGCTYGRLDEPPFDEVVEVFGDGWIDYWDQRPPPALSMHGPLVPPPTPTAPHGNAHVVYNFDNENLTRGLDLAFWPDARFGRIIVGERQR